jgi:hypothetical protein
MNFKVQLNNLKHPKTKKNTVNEEYVLNFQNFSETLKEPNVKLQKLKDKIKNTNFYLIKINKSNVNINGNIFKNNDGNLVFIEEQHNLRVKYLKGQHREQENGMQSSNNSSNSIRDT